MIDYLHILGVSGEFSDSEEMGRYYSTSLPPSMQPLPAPSFIISHPDPNPSASYNVDSFVNLNDKVSPSILLIIIILAIVFFVSGLLHLLVRFLWRPQTREPDDYLDNVTALQGQLQQLFHLHDAGVDQSYIDTLPVFHYKAIIGLKNPFDCAVCLCEFEPEDQLRLLPKCSHAFHVDCIDTWLLSHSTCPLCRATLLPDFSPTTNFSPFVFVLESGSDTSREIVPERENNAVGRTSTHSREFGSTRVDLSHKSDDLTSDVITVKLGKFRNVDNNNGGEGSSVVVNSISDARRCFSMGSFAYVMEENSSLQVPVRATTKKPASKKAALPLTPGHRYAMSECDCESNRDFKFVGLDHATRSNESNNGVDIFSGGAAIGGSRKESFSVSKIWLQEKKPNNERVGDSSSSSSRRAVSFRFSGPSNKNGKLEKWENDEENQSCYSVDSQGRAPSFARRTLLWLTGRQNKVVHSSSASNS